MDTHTLAGIRSKVYATEALYASSGHVAELQWRVGPHNRFEIHYTNAAGWSATHMLAHQNVMEEPHADWLTAELAAHGIALHTQDAERIIQQYAIATTANWHPRLPKLQRQRAA